MKLIKGYIFYYISWIFDSCLKFFHRKQAILLVLSSHTKDSKMVLDTNLLSNQHYKVKIKGKVEQSREWNRALSFTSV